MNRSLWFYLFAFAAAGQTAPARGPLRILSSNPRYFSDGAGKAIYLTGTHNWNNFPGGRAVFSTPFPGPAVLYLKRTGGGSVRVRCDGAVRIEELETPALLVDLNLMEANLERMAAFFRGVPAKLRPHFKNHKCPDFAARQLGAGAIGITCATLREAECLVHHGIRSVVLANEIVDAAKIRRFVELTRSADAIVCVDNEMIAGDLARVARDRKTQVSVLVDVDVGLHRCGLPPGEAVVRLARSVAEKGLRFRGLMGYEGHVLRKPPGPEKEEAAAAAMRPLMETKACLDQMGMAVEIVSVGGTGTYSISGRYPGVTEIQAGSHLLMDTDYRKCCTDFDPALTVLTTVLSKTEDERIVVDVGLKTLSCERGIPAVKDLAGVATRRLTAEHGIIDIQDPAVPLQVGDRIEMWVHYSDATVNLHERIYGVRNGCVEEVFRVEG